MPPEELINPR